MTAPEQRRALVESFRSSGLTAAAFARREGLKYQTFAGWVNRSRHESTPAPAVRFAQVSLPAAGASNRAALEVQLGDGTLVRGHDARAVAELARALQD